MLFNPHLLFLFKYKGICKPCVIITSSGYSDLFVSECWLLFSQSGFDRVELIVDVGIQALLYEGIYQF